MACAIRDYNRVAIKGGHGTGKSQSLGAIIPWFLHVFQPSIVLTTAPGAKQVKNQTWSEMRKQLQKSTCELLPGLLPSDSAWNVAPMHQALGVTTDTQQQFRGVHAENLLIIVEEAEGVDATRIEEAENMCVAPNNKIIAVSNAIIPHGWFYDCFKADSGWHCVTLNCMNHPNVLTGRPVIPGAVTKEWVDKRVKKYCIPIDISEKQAGDFEYPVASRKIYRPTSTFQARVLGEFPNEGPDTLLPLSWIIAARNNEQPIDSLSKVDLGFDVAYSGGDWCVIFARRGPSVIKRWKWQGDNPEKAKLKGAGIIKELTEAGLNVGTVAIDAIGIGSGVAYGLMAMLEEGVIKCDRVIPVQVSEKARNDTLYPNRRAELAYALAERFRLGEADLSRLGEDAADFESQAPQINKTRETQKLRQTIMSKDKMRETMKISPDDFDAMCFCFIDTVDTFAESYAMCIDAE